MSGDSLKAQLLRAAGRATMTVQTEAPPYKYVCVEGRVTLLSELRDDFEMASATWATRWVAGMPRTTRAPPLQ
jgi:hypothetical protein